MNCPGVVSNIARRLSFDVLKMKVEVVFDFLKILMDVQRELEYCSVCGHITDVDPCYICSDKQRDRSMICVVQDTKDVIAMEKMREYNGLYHVLHGAISPMDGIGSEDINVISIM